MGTKAPHKTQKPISIGGYKDAWHQRKLNADAAPDPNSAKLVAQFLKDMNSWASLPTESPGDGKQFSTALIETSDADPVWTISSYDRNANLDNMAPPCYFSKGVEKVNSKGETVKEVPAVQKTNSAGNIFYTTDNPANPKTYNGATLSSFHAPAGVAKMVADGGDKPFQIRNIDTKEEIGSWLTIIDEANHHITCAWGYYLEDYTKSDGRLGFPRYCSDMTPDGRYNSKVSASGLAMSTYTVRIEELLDGIHHPIGMAVPSLYQAQTVDPVNPKSTVTYPCYPAVSSDGQINTTDNPDTYMNYLQMGQMCRLDPKADYSNKHWHPAMRKFITACQVYGFMPTDTNGPGSVTFAGIIPNQYDEYMLAGKNAYETRVFGPSSEMVNGEKKYYQENWVASYFSGGATDDAGVKYDPFPWEDMQVMPVCHSAEDYAKITVPDTVENWEAVDVAIGELNELRREMYAAIDNFRANDQIARDAISATGTSSASTAASVSPATETSSGSGLYTA